MMLTARNAALHPGGFFTAKSLGNARGRSQARRLLSLYEGSGVRKGLRLSSARETRPTGDLEAVYSAAPARRPY